MILVGPPNSGKTTVFNWLTQSRFRAVNYPGSTVDYLTGQLAPRFGPTFQIVDTPGVYSVSPSSPDEEVTARILHQDQGSPEGHLVVCCLDATQIDRQLPLLLEIRDLNWPVVLVLTMSDLAQDSGIVVDRSGLEERLRVPVALVDGKTGHGIEDLARLLQSWRNKTKNVYVPSANESRPRAELARESTDILKSNFRRNEPLTSPRHRTERWDRLVLHPIYGPLIFVLSMVLLFVAIFSLAQPLMDGIDQGFAALGNWIHGHLPPGAGTDFLADGLVASLAAVLVFLPQIFILFVGLGILEDSGYLARAATLIDRPLAKLGLSGRAFVPLLSGYACAVPAILATRTIRSRRERWIAIMILPILSCSARLPVYGLLLALAFWGRPAWMPALALALIYLASMVVGALAAGVLARISHPDKASNFLLELPLYRRPQWRVILRSAWSKTQSYATRAGPIIFGLALALWLGSHYPRGSQDLGQTAQMEQSYLGQAGRLLEPVFQPMGVDWRVGVGLISAFAAREVFVSALALVFDVSSDGQEDGVNQGLLNKLQEAQTVEGLPLFSLASIFGLVAFFMIALQCTSTTAVVARELGSAKSAVSQLVALNIVAYAVAISLYQILKFIGFA